MRALFLAVLLGGVWSFHLAADSHRVDRTSVDGNEMVLEIYQKGKLLRTEIKGTNHLAPRVTIRNFDQKTVFTLDPRSREYTESRLENTDLISAVAQWISRPAPLRQSGKTVDVYFETVDTGERKRIFGQTARHLIIRERRVAENGACDSSRTEERDGWYIPRSGNPGQVTPSHHQVSYLAIRANTRCQDQLILHGNPMDPGLAVRERSASVMHEVLELSDLPLPLSLFAVPPGFTKVNSLGGDESLGLAQRLEFDLAELNRALSSWFE